MKKQGKRNIKTMEDVILHANQKMAKITKNCEICGKKKRVFYFQNKMICDECLRDDMDKQDEENKNLIVLHACREQSGFLEGC